MKKSITSSSISAAMNARNGIKPTRPTAPPLSARDRTFAAFERAVVNDFTKVSRKDAATIKAMSDTMQRVLESVTEDARSHIFGLFEYYATAANARKIASHALRSPEVDDMLAEARAGDEAAIAAAEQAALEQAAAEAAAEAPGRTASDDREVGP